MKGMTKINGIPVDIDRLIYKFTDINWAQIDPVTKLTNIELVLLKRNVPFAPDGTKMILHHIYQMEQEIMVELSSLIHSSNHKILHQLVGKCESFRNIKLLKNLYENSKNQYWRLRALEFLESLPENEKCRFLRKEMQEKFSKKILTF